LYPVLEFQFEKSGWFRSRIYLLPYLTEKSRKLRHFFFLSFIYNSIKSLKMTDLFCSFSFWSSLTKWVYMHNLLKRLKIATFPFSTFQLTPVSIQPELASQQPIILRPFIC